MFAYLYGSNELDLQGVLNLNESNFKLPLYYSNDSYNTNIVDGNPLYKDQKPDKGRALWFDFITHKPNLINALISKAKNEGTIVENRYYYFMRWIENENRFKAIPNVYIECTFTLAYNTVYYDVDEYITSFNVIYHFGSEQISPVSQSYQIYDLTQVQLVAVGSPSVDYGRCCTSIYDIFAQRTLEFKRDTKQFIPTPPSTYAPYSYHAFVFKNNTTYFPENSRISIEWLNNSNNTIRYVESITTQGTSYNNVQYMGLYNRSNTTEFWKVAYPSIDYSALPPTEDDDEDEGEGKKDNSSDKIDFSTIPSISMSASMIKSYYLNTTELTNFSNDMWDIDTWDAIQQKFNSNRPMDFVIGLKVFPSNINIGTSGTSVIKLGFWESQESYNKIGNRFVEKDMGTLKLDNYYANYLDYNTKVQIYLPFIGTHSLDTNVIMGSELKLVYRVDLLTGECLASIRIKRTQDGTELSSVIYQYNGNMGIDLPVTSGSYSNMGLALASSCATMLASSISPTALTSGQRNAIGNGTNMLNTLIPDSIPSQKSGSIGGSSGVMAILKPYLIIERDISQIPSNYDKLKGYTSVKSKTIGSCKGKTYIDSVNITFNCLESEKQNIENILKSGIYIK